MAIDFLKRFLKVTRCNGGHWITAKVCNWRDPIYWIYFFLFILNLRLHLDVRKWHTTLFLGQALSMAQSTSLSLIDISMPDAALGTFKAGRISHLASRILHVISLYNIDLKDRLEPCVTSDYL